MKAKPFLKWAGGKGQLLEKIDNFLPQELKQGKLKTYIEPFVGSGAVFFYLAQTYHFENIYLLDINPELFLAYQTIQRDVEALIEQLSVIQAEYLNLEQEARKKYYYEVRSRFNHQRLSTDFERYNAAWIDRTAQLVFLNRTCFNGLFRVNSQGNFNVPMGRYKQPKICDSENLRSVARILEKTTVELGDFSHCEPWVDSHTFVYFDPPYRPISKTSVFTSYSKYSFDDSEQIRLRDYFALLDRKGAKLMLSNSDPKNQDSTDNFFDRAYKGYRTERVMASRSINSNTKRRGQINELLIMNY